MEHRQSTLPVAEAAGLGTNGLRVARAESKMTGAARFWDRVAEGYAKKPVADEAAYQKKLETTREYLRPDMNVLEFGCGTGSTALVHAPFVKHLHAIDISSKMIEIAQRKATAANVTNLSFAQAAIEDFDAPDETFDAVLGMSVLHLLKDRDAAISKVHRLLKPGGVFVSSTACIKDMSRIFGIVLPIGHALGFLPLVKVFGLDELKQALLRAGFTIDHEWRPGKRKAVFIVARKAG